MQAKRLESDENCGPDLTASPIDAFCRISQEESLKQQASDADLQSDLTEWPPTVAPAGGRE
jgi:hypothetical protein